MNPRQLWILLVPALSLLMPGMAAAQLRIEINRGVSEAVPVAVVPFAYQGQGTAPIDAADVIAAWASRYIDAPVGESTVPDDVVRVTETGQGKFQNTVTSGRHHLIADEPTGVGGLDTGPTPYDYVSVGLGACTSMTLRMYADHKKLPVTRISVDVKHGKVHAADCADCADEARDRDGRIDEDPCEDL